MAAKEILVGRFTLYVSFYRRTSWHSWYELVEVSFIDLRQCQDIMNVRWFIANPINAPKKHLSTCTVAQCFGFLQSPHLPNSPSGCVRRDFCHLRFFVLQICSNHQSPLTLTTHKYHTPNSQFPPQRSTAKGEPRGGFFPSNDRENSHLWIKSDLQVYISTLQLVFFVDFGEKFRAFNQKSFCQSNPWAKIAVHQPDLHPLQKKKQMTQRLKWHVRVTCQQKLGCRLDGWLIAWASATWLDGSHRWDSSPFQ